jgi:hypothetical protein
MNSSSRVQKSRTVKVPGSPLKKAPERLPWPRMADDGKTPIGVDVVAKRQDIVKITHKYFHVEGVPIEDLLQEIYLAIVHKNRTQSAHDPRKSSFGHYVYMVANHVCINLVHRKRRYDKERDSIDAPYGGDDQRTLLDVFDVEAEAPKDTSSEVMEDMEAAFRQRGMWDLARYVRAARSGFSSEVIREALSWGARKVSNKSIRDIRSQVQDAIREIAVQS